MTTADNPTSIANQALDQAGLTFTLGDIQDGTRPAQVCLRWYTECVRQLLRSAHWDFARREADLVLIADATGQTANVGTIVPSQFIYAYEYPTVCAKVRFIPRNPLLQPAVPSSNIQPANPSSPLTTGTGAPPYLTNPQIPSRFLISNIPDYIPSNIQQGPTDTRGISPTGRLVILSNVQNAKAVFTIDAMYPNVWDHKFRQAVVSLLAAYIALPLHTQGRADKAAVRLGTQMRDDNAKLAMQAIQAARISDGNEGWYSSDISVDWLRIRNNGGGFGNWGAWDGPGPGYCIGGWDSVMIPGGSAF